jgi:phage shock protein A
MSNLPPEVVIENLLSDLNDSYADLKKLAASMVRRRDDAAAELDNAKRELSELQQQLDGAVATEHDADALTLLERREALTAQVETLQAALDVADTDANEAKTQLVTLKAKIQELERDKPKLIAKATVANIKNELEGLSLDSELATLGRVREHIHNTVAQVDLNRELASAEAGTTPSAPPPRVDPEAKARAQLEELKRARAAQNQGKSPKRL